MNAFLVLYLLVAPSGPAIASISLPFPSVEACERYLKHPAPFVTSHPTIRAAGSCIARDAPMGEPKLDIAV